LKVIYEEGAPAILRELRSVEVLRQVWVQQFYLEEERVYWRKGTAESSACASNDYFAR
jgi:hypothetical protein